VTTLNLDPWWDEPAYRSATGTFSERGTFILRKLSEHDPIRFKTVMDDLYRDEPPDPVDITKFQWQTTSPPWAPAKKRSRTCSSAWGGWGGERAEARARRPYPTLAKIAEAAQAGVKVET
jgi:hypothetical protein